MHGYSSFYAQSHVGDRVRVYRCGVDLGEAVIIALTNPGTDKTIRFKYLNDKLPNPYDSMNMYRGGYSLRRLLTPLRNPMDPRE